MGNCNSNCSCREDKSVDARTPRRSSKSHEKKGHPSSENLTQEKHVVVQETLRRRSPKKSENSSKELVAERSVKGKSEILGKKHPISDGFAEEISLKGADVSRTENAEEVSVGGADVSTTPNAEMSRKIHRAKAFRFPDSKSVCAKREEGPDVRNSSGKEPRFLSKGAESSSSCKVEEKETQELEEKCENPRSETLTKLPPLTSVAASSSEPPPIDLENPMITLECFIFL